MRIAIAAALLCGALAAAPASGAPASCATLGGVVEAGAQCRIQSSGADHTMDITFPLDYPDNQAIVDYLSQTRSGFLNVAQTPGTRTVPHQMTVTAESFRSARTRSVVLTLFQEVGGAHPSTWFKSFTYDVERSRSRSTRCSPPTPNRWTPSSRSCNAAWKPKPASPEVFPPATVATRRTIRTSR
jgi:hypothetical protein